MVDRTQYVSVKQLSKVGNMKFIHSKLLSDRHLFYAGRQSVMRHTLSLAWLRLFCIGGLSTRYPSVDVWAHSFPRQFCQIPRASSQNSTARIGKIIQISLLTAVFRLCIN